MTSTGRPRLGTSRAESAASRPRPSSGLRGHRPIARKRSTGPSTPVSHVRRLTPRGSAATLAASAAAPASPPGDPRHALVPCSGGVHGPRRTCRLAAPGGGRPVLTSEGPGGGPPHHAGSCTGLLCVCCLEGSWPSVPSLVVVTRSGEGRLSSSSSTRLWCWCRERGAPSPLRQVCLSREGHLLLLLLLTSVCGGGGRGRRA